ncbi:MAG: hypothetical protein WC445_02025 [Patescibacteria group bacterium]
MKKALKALSNWWRNWWLVGAVCFFMFGMLSLGLLALLADKRADKQRDSVTVRINSKDEQSAEIYIFHAVDPGDASNGDVSYGPAMFEVRLTKAQACGRAGGVEVNARRTDGRWYGDLGMLDRLMVTVDGLSVEPAVIRHPWIGGEGNLLLTPQMLGCSS